MKKIPDSKKFTVAREEGRYLAFTGVAHVGDRLVCAYNRADQHCRTEAEVMVAVSDDKGRTWKNHRSLAKSSCEETGGIWVSPEISALPDGRLVILCDYGVRPPGVRQPNLHTWQKPPLGMSNHVFWSSDRGETWEGPVKVDDLGGEPDRIIGLSDGSLVYTATEARDLDDRPEIREMIRPPEWLKWFSSTGYYANILMASEDGGRTFHKRSDLSDDPLFQDCEVGLAEVRPGEILAVTRCGMYSGSFGHPSRMIWSRDGGRTWEKPLLAPFYGQRPIPGKLQSGKILVSFRNRWGTSGSAVCLFDPDEEPGFQPNSWIWDESRCRLENGEMIVESTEGAAGAVEFTLYPTEDYKSRAEMEAELSVADADTNACALAAGFWVSVFPDRIELTERPEISVPVDARNYHRYRLLREKGRAIVQIDGKTVIDEPVEGISTKFVHFGNRAAGKGGNPYSANAGLSRWRSVRAVTDNVHDHRVTWEWEAASETYPDQFRRDHVTFLDLNGSFVAGNSGYSGWTQMDDGTIVVCDYTYGEQIVTDAEINSEYDHERQKNFPFIRAYVFREEDLGQ